MCYAEVIRIKIKNMFGYTIIKKSRVYELIEKEATLHKLIEYKVFDKPEPTLNCGYKSCNFQTTSPRGLKLHRTKIHKKK